MKTKFLSILLLALIVGLLACKKTCEPKNKTCGETPPKDELCMAYFERWFYNTDKNTCEFVAYSGCSLKGFATQQECEACKCQ